MCWFCACPCICLLFSAYQHTYITTVVIGNNQTTSCLWSIIYKVWFRVSMKLHLLNWNLTVDRIGSKEPIWKQKWKEFNANLMMKTEFHILIYFYFLLFFIIFLNALKIDLYKFSDFFLVSVLSLPFFLYKNNIFCSDLHKNLM